ncbi:ABC transporter permease [Streptomyces sp. NPDC003023]|uniref:ABC transporter permease n=1 Tax=Streptomyces sp. NPDC003023 TaxID=3364675 RepID=UPI00367D7262
MSTSTTARPLLRGVTWVVVRQHRRLLLVPGLLLVVDAAVAFGLRIAHDSTPYDEEAHGLFSRSAYHGGLTASADFLANAALLLPLLVAAVVAGPVIARELESGTCKLVWSQSVPPVRWLVAKTAVSAVAVTVACACVILLFRILRGPVAGDYRLSWYDRQVFLALGPTTIAYALLAVAIGALTGLLVRRTLAAMSVAGLATGAVMVIMALLWGRLWPTVTAERQGATLDGEWYNTFVTEHGLLTSTGERLPDLNACDGTGYEACFAREDVVGRFMDHHPYSHLWPLQLVETGIVLALAAAAVHAAFRIFRRRHV